ncbi:hypothetical protein LH128_01242 [Sphingomonas sp. LH128]|uniref:hypothetical protein n=1 Tax=Sphingomonas sp. LH128 TaxID=473781 RepID=UPI00027CC48A|nr:hypothetical protein [Sphingomonas sp. LH128]EJU14958.1 hypothetical protein LH128_01242 [Sphingomonas sp. LH128]
MTFQFTVHPQDDIAPVCYELPALPAGVGYDLTTHINSYRDAVINGPDGRDEELFLNIKSHKARGLPEVIAKVIYQLHFDHRGLAMDSDRLVITESDEQDRAEIRLAELLLAELYSQIPDDWEAARRALHAAVLVEDDFERRLYEPSKDGGKNDPITAELERLLDARCDAETVLLNLPAPSLADWAVKFLICFDCDRDMNGFTEALCKEARQLLGIAAEPGDDHSNDLAVMAAALASRHPAAGKDA